MRLILFILTFFAFCIANAQKSFTSVQNGDWNDASTWTLGAGAGGVEGDDYPAANDIVIVDHNVIINATNNGANFTFTGELTINENDTLESQVGSNVAGFVLDGDGIMRNYGSFFTLDATEDPDPFAHIPYDFICQGNSIFIGGLNSFAFISDDWVIDDNAQVFIDNLLCYAVSDDVNFESSTCFMYGTGNVRIGGDGTNSTVNFNGGSSVAQLDDDITIWRNVATNDCSGTALAVGTSALIIPPFAIEDNYITVINTAQNQFVLTQGTDDFSPTVGDNLTITSVGSNALATNGSSSQGGTVSINNNGTPGDPSDDYVVYSPFAGFTGTDTYNYLITNDAGGTDIAEVTVIVSATNDDIDGDGISNANDIDDDNDGILDVDEGCGSTPVYSGSVTSQSGVTNSANVTGVPDDNFAELHSNGDIMVIDFGQIYTAGTQYAVTWRRRPGDGVTAIPIVEESTDNAAYTTHSTVLSTTNDVTFQTDIVTSENDFRYLRFSKDNPPSVTDYQLDAVAILETATDVSSLAVGGTGSYTITQDGDITIDMKGGDGGGGSAEAGGEAASITAVFTVTAGDVIRYVVGAGSDGSGTNSAGGGGSTGLFINNTLVMVAGGGGGGDNSGGASGLGGNSGTAGDAGTGAQNGAAGTAGSGGGVNVANVVGAGGGINSAGAGSGAGGGAAADLVPGDGVTFVSGGAGSGNSTAGGSGFTGGGGGGDGSWSGGGGGYSGGGGAGDGGSAGGGGSYVDVAATGYVSSTITAGADAGGGASGADGSDGFVTISQSICIDTDNDGTPDSQDLDSDGDGIADIVEAGGTDTNGDGVVDGTFTDTDGDGWSDTFDSDNGGTALVDSDTDGDGLENRIDIDSDDDGIVDIIESQLSGVLISPSGTDSDGDGIDDNFDTDNGNTLTTPINTDGTDNPDYTDTNSDNDDEDDILEAWDTDNDGVADTSPAGTDSDNDGLDDNFDDVVGPNSTTNVTDGGETSDSFPDLDRPDTDERDWRENKDSDNDGVADIDDVDDDNDGILDVDECEGSLIFEGGFENLSAPSFGNNLNVSILPWITASPTNVIQVDGPGGANYGIGGPEFDARGGAGNYYDINGSGIIYQAFTIAGNRTLFYDGFFSARDGATGTGDITIHAGTGDAGAVQSTTGTITTSDNTDWTYASNTIDLTAGTYSFVVTLSNPINFDEGGIAVTCDTDGDGITNQYDLDSDGDGIADIIEAGGVDIDGDGVVDGIFADTDGDGLSDTFDPLYGGGALELPDTDGDGLNNSIDIDSDDDGIIDIIEAFGSGLGISPSGTDSDFDGIDDNFDTDDGNSLTTPVDTDSDGIPDYIDTNSDNDSQTDRIEAWDTDNDGVADVVALGTDTDGDGLDDAFDNIVGPNTTTNITNNGQNSGDFPNLDLVGTTELDWREIEDSDSDGIPDEFDIDDDNDGILDELERNCTSGFADAVETNVGVGSPNNSLGKFDTQNSQVNSGDILGLDLTDDVLEGHIIRIRIERNNNNTILVEGSIDNAAFTNPVRYGNFGTFDVDMPTIDSLYYFDYEVGAGGARYIRFTREVGSTDVDGVAYAQECVSLDTDGDGVDDHLDLDADNDGIADIIEAGGVDTDNDGRVDDNTDTDDNGYADTFDTNNGGTELPVTDTDGDGLENYLDIDSDSDGIIDNIEGQTTAGFRASQGSDTDGDGWDDEYDSDNGGTAINLSNNDASGDPDYIDADSDEDGLVDWMEGYDDNDTEDALDDYIARAVAFEIAAGNPLYYLSSLDTDLDGIPDFLEDDDANGLPNFADPGSAFFRDTDGDGLIDLVDSDNFGVIPSLPDGDGDGEYDFRDSDDQVSLPIELLDFTAKKDNQYVKLDWRTQTEINNDYFVIEKLSANQEFLEIGRLDGAGNSDQIKWYRLFDYKPSLGFNYYRLKQVDYDGTVSYSEIQQVNFVNSIQKLTIFPNPYREGKLNVVLSGFGPGRINLQLLDSDGKIYIKRQVVTENSTNSNSIELLQGKFIAPGTYILQITTGEKIAYEKLIVL